MNQQDADYTYHLAVGSHGLARRLAQLETDKARKERKRRVVEKETIEAVERSLEWMKDQRAA